jgi:hypothetical protein
MKRIILTLILALAVSPALAQQRPFAAKPALNLPIDPLGLNSRAPRRRLAALEDICSARSTPSCCPTCNTR